MFDFLTLQPEVFGMDISDASLRVVKLKKKRKGFSVSYIEEAEIKPGIVKEGVIQDPQALGQALKKLCGPKGKKIGTRHVAISLPEKKSFFQVIQMPNMTLEELATAVPIEAENYIPLPIDKVYLDFQLVPSKKESSYVEVLINGMQKPIIDSYVSCIKSAGLVPTILEVESAAIARALIPEGLPAQAGQESPPLIFLDLGQDNTIFTIYSGNSIRFTSSLLVSSQQLTNAIKDKLGISFTEAEKLKLKYGLTPKGEEKHHIAAALKPLLSDLALQIKKYISFYQGHLSAEDSSGGHIHKIILCGGGANLKKIPEWLSKELHLPVEVGDSLVNVSSKRGTKIPQEKALSFTTVIGLALRGANQKS